jgi:cytochrome c556
MEIHCQLAATGLAWNIGPWVALDSAYKLLLKALITEEPMKMQDFLIRSGFISGAAVIILASASLRAGAREETHQGAASAHPAQSGPVRADNPLVEEMRVLDGVFREVVSGVAVGDGRRVHAAIEKMHGKMEKTQEGVRHGTVMLKKNPDRLSDFEKQDKEFHDTLEVLAEAALKNDSSIMLTATKKLLDGCIRCHRDFRKS